MLQVAGRDDPRVLPVHAERMTAALKWAGVPVQMLHCRHLLAFLADSLGGATAGPVAAPARRGSRAP